MRIYIYIYIYVCVCVCECVCVCVCVCVCIIDYGASRKTMFNKYDFLDFCKAREPNPPKLFHWIKILLE